MVELDPFCRILVSTISFFIIWRVRKFLTITALIHFKVFFCKGGDDGWRWYEQFREISLIFGFALGIFKNACVYANFLGMQFRNGRQKLGNKTFRFDLWETSRKRKEREGLKLEADNCFGKKQGFFCIGKVDGEE